jgi:DNA mismatch repair ATPase MutL
MKSIIENTLENFRINQIAEIKDIKENFYRSIAKSTAVKYGQILTKPEMLKIIEELFSLNEYTYSPAGKKIFKEIEHNDISSYFKK